MATKPTRRQQQARDLLAEALYLITEASRADETTRLDGAELETIASRLGRLCPAFGLDAIVPRALERRCAALGLRPEAVELLTLLDVDVPPLEMLRLDADALRALVTRLETELGEVD